MQCRVCHEELSASRFLDGVCKTCSDSEKKDKEIKTAYVPNPDDSFIKAEEGNSDGLKIIDASIPFGSVLILVFKIAISILIVYLIFLPILGLLGFAGLTAFF